MYSNNTATIIDTTGIDITSGQASRTAQLRVTSAKKRSEGSVMDAHREWAKRPEDEAVYTFSDLLSRTKNQRDTSRELDAVSWGSLSVRPGNGRGLALVGPAGNAIHMSTWAAQQLCNVIGAPHEYVTGLPASLAADCFNHGIQNNCARTGEAQIMIRSGREGLEVRSMTSQRYTRVWDYEIAEMADRLQSNGTWGPCEAFKSASADRVANAWSASKRLPLGWVGDRSTFVALADYEGAVTINGAKLARFALLSNSEVGAQGLKIVFGLMDFACANFILWGCQQVTEVTARHVGDVRDRFQRLTAPMSKRLSSEQNGYITSGLTAAQRTLVADTQEDVFTKVSQVTKLPKAHLERAWELAEGTPRYGNPRSVWGMIAGLTEASQELHSNADKRTKADSDAAKLMSLVR